MLVGEYLKSIRICAGDICAIWGFNEQPLIKYFFNSNPDHITSIWLEGKTETFLSGYLRHLLMVNINRRIRRRKSETLDEFNHRKELVDLFRMFYTNTDFYNQLVLDASIRLQEEELEYKKRQDDLRELDNQRKQRHAVAIKELEDLKATVKKRLFESDGDYPRPIIDFGVNFSFQDAMLRIEEHEKRSRARREDEERWRAKFK